VGNGNYVRHLLEISRNPVWAYDTFDGAFPIDTVGELENRDVFVTGGQSSHYGVKISLEASGVVCVEGVFPDTFQDNHPDSVAFVHVDMDTYLATKAALELFHPLMVEDGVFMVHDYNNQSMNGVKQAVDEFCNGPYGNFYTKTIDYEDHYRLVKIATQ